MELFSGAVKKIPLNHLKDSYKHRLSDKSVNDLFDYVVVAIKYSLLREFRHYGRNVFKPLRSKNISKMSDMMYQEFTEKLNACSTEHDGNTICDPTYKDALTFVTACEKEMKTLRINWFHFIDIYDEKREWEEGYGGKKWQMAAKLLCEITDPKFNKILWLDRVIDLSHNNGKLMNKSFLYILFKRKQIGHRSSYHRKNCLNYRYQAESLSKLLTYCSTSVKMFIEANNKLIPEKLYGTC